MDARAVCLGFEGDLVSIENEKEMEFVDNIASGSLSRSDNIFIGLIDRLKDGEFAWSDGTYFNSSVYNNWYGNQPNGGAEYCGVYELNRKGWHDYSCSIRYFDFGYICKKRKGGLLFSVTILN